MEPTETTMETLTIVQIVLAVLLIIAVLLQQSESGLGAVFGSDDGGPRRTRRGAERVLFISTIVLAVLFAGASVLALVL